MLLIQITAAHGPAECALAAKLTLQTLIDDAQNHSIEVEVLEETSTTQGVKSALLALQGEHVALWLRTWQGTIQWVFASPYRLRYPRKNWFVGVQVCPQEAQEGGRTALRDEDLVFQACKASGKGGQHVNTTDSAVHAVHLPTGLAVKVMTARSQHANKALARALIALKLDAQRKKAHAHAKATRTQLHWTVDRGNPIRVFEAIFAKEGRVVIQKR